MSRAKLCCSVALAGALAVSFAGPASAQPVDQRTYFTFSGPFELPGGKTLPAGKYTFRIGDSPSNRHIVQVMSQDGRQMYATLLAIPAQRNDPPSDPEIRFMEAPANTPPAIRTWWYPGRTIGHEFIYPKDQARRIAARQNEPVLTVAGNETSPEEIQHADLERMSASGDSTRVTNDDTARDTDQAHDRTARAQTTAPAPQPTATQPETTTQPTRTSQSTPTTRRTMTTPRQTTTADHSRAPRTQLPRTASPLPLIGLSGVLALSLAAALRFLRA